MVNKLLLMKKRGLVPGAIAYWDCTQVVGQVLPDLSGNDNHGQLGSTAGADTNDPTPTQQGLTFGGDDRVRCGPGADGTADRGVTVQIVAATSSSATVRQTVISKSGAAPTGSGYMIQRNNLDPTHWRAYIYDGTGNRVIPDVVGHPDGTYGMISVAVDGTTARVYSGSTPGTPVSCVGYTPAPLLETVIGALSTDASAPLNAGSVVVCGMVYPFALTSAQIAQNHAYFKAKFAPYGVILP